MEDNILFIILGGIAGIYIGIIIGIMCGQPTELPNKCILHNDVIYCEEASK